jgi:hypothetical protein
MLLKNGAKFSLVQKVVGNKINLVSLAEEIAMNDMDMSLDRNISLLKKSDKLQSSDPFFDKIVN